MGNNDGDNIVMHQPMEDFVTPQMCEMHHKIIEAQLEVLRQKDKALEEKIGGIEKRLDAMDAKIDQMLRLQSDIYKFLIWLTVGIICTLIGVLAGRAIDFGWLV